MSIIKNVLFLLPFICFTAGYFVCSLILQQPQIAAPSLVGLSIADACQSASRADIAIKLLGDTEDNTVPPGTVLRQTPPAGQGIKPYQSMYVLISKQQEYPKAPTLIGMTVPELTAMSSAHRIKIYHVPSLQPRGLCFAQTPIAHEPVTTNHIIAYVCAESTKPIIWPDFTGQLVQDVCALLETHALHADIIHTDFHHNDHRCQDCRVIYQNPRPGCLLNIDSPKLTSIQLQVE